MSLGGGRGIFRFSKEFIFSYRALCLFGNKKTTEVKILGVIVNRVTGVGMRRVDFI